MAESFNIGTEIVSGVKEVFSTMLMKDVENDEPIVGEKTSKDSNLTSMIGLGGDMRGVLAIHCPTQVATAITGGFLGMEIEEIDEDVKDAVGEIANMVAGNLKISFEKIGVNVKLAIPTAIVGESFQVRGIADAERVVVPVYMDGMKFWVELMHVLNS